VDRAHRRCLAADISPRLLAGIAGGLYLINIVGGAFAIGFVRSTLVVSGDPAATASNIQAHELLYRSGLAAHLVVTVTNVPLAVIFYDLFKVVNRRLALLDACFILVGAAIEAAGLVNEFGLLVGARVDLSGIDYDIHTVFFGCDAICIAYLIVRSTFLPRGIGVLMAIDGLAYLLYSFTDVLAPALAAHLVPWIQLPALIGEGSLCLWLLIVGVDVERWTAARS
jgi:hypothetical protein